MISITEQNGSTYTFLIEDETDLYGYFDLEIPQYFCDESKEEPSDFSYFLDFESLDFPKNSDEEMNKKIAKWIDENHLAIDNCFLCYCR